MYTPILLTSFQPYTTFRDFNAPTNCRQCSKQSDYSLQKSPGFPKSPQLLYLRNMTESVTQKSYHHGNLRAELLDTAVEQLREVGTEELSLRALARAIGVSQTAPYRHFADKGELDKRKGRREPIAAPFSFFSFRRTSPVAASP